VKPMFLDSTTYTRVDPNRADRGHVGATSDLVPKGKVRASRQMEAGAANDPASTQPPVSAVQIEYSLDPRPVRSRDPSLCDGAWHWLCRTTPARRGFLTGNGRRISRRCGRGTHGAYSRGVRRYLRPQPHERGADGRMPRQRTALRAAPLAGFVSRALNRAHPVLSHIATGLEEE